MGIKDLLEVSKELISVEPAKLVCGDREFLSQVCKPATIVEAEKLWSILKATTKKYGGFGLAANQIGILKAVAYIEFAGKEYNLLNPRIISVGNEKILTLNEGCLSFPKKSCNTVRETCIVVEDDNLGCVELRIENDGLLTFIFQHEIDHLYGRTIFDNVLRPQRIVVQPGRNALCPCGSGEKYKKCCLLS